jgi:hypothetical protein
MCQVFLVQVTLAFPYLLLSHPPFMLNTIGKSPSKHVSSYFLVSADLTMAPGYTYFVLVESDAFPMMALLAFVAELVSLPVPFLVPAFGTDVDISLP